MTVSPKRGRRAATDPGPLHLQRLIHDARSSRTIPGELVRSERDPPTGDAAVDEAFDGLGNVAQFFHAVYGRNSLDGKGSPITATVHYSTNYNNAFWNGRQMIFGDGDNIVFRRFTLGLEMIGFYFTRGITSYDMKVEYWGQAGALSTSICDVFGSLAKQYQLRQTADQADWLMGETIIAPGFIGRAIRSLAEPGTAYDDTRLGKDPQPAHMSNYVETPNDNGGVHLNCSIPSRAFYLAAVSVGGYAWETAGQVWYEAMRTRRLRKSVTFADFARVTIKVAGRLHGAYSPVTKAVADGWQTVGVLPANDKA